MRRRRDTVHNYIALTDLEWSLICDKSFQKLHFILQNSCAYVSYPTAMGSRYAHTLGVIHLGGRMLESALRNSDPEHLAELLDAAKQLFDSVGGHDYAPLSYYADLSWEHVHLLAPHLNFPHHCLQNSDPIISSFLVAFIWQSLRVACLFHDIGHFPYSHVLEFAVRNYVASKAKVPGLDFPLDNERDFVQPDPLVREIYQRQKGVIENQGSVVEGLMSHPSDLAIHEMMGLEKLNKFLSPTSPHVPADDETAKRLWQKNLHLVIFRTARYIFLASNDVAHPETPAAQRLLLCLHEVVSGKLDADRLDYCLRDPETASLEMGAIDAERIIENMIFTIEPETRRMSIIPTARALSAVESFFHQRFQIYRYLIYHHGVARMDAVLEEITTHLLSIAVSHPEEDPVGKLLVQFGFWSPAEPRHFSCGDNAGHEDGWYRTLLRQILAVLEKTHAALSEGRRNLRLLLQVFLTAGPRNITSLWKRDADYLQFVAECLGESASEKPQFEKSLERLRGLVGGGDLKAHIEDLQNELRDQEYPILLLVRYTPDKVIHGKQGEREFRMWIGADRRGRPDVRPGVDVSSYLESLERATSHCAPFQLVLVGNELRQHPLQLDIAIKKIKSFFNTLLKHPDEELNSPPPAPPERLSR